MSQPRLYGAWVPISWDIASCPKRLRHLCQQILELDSSAEASASRHVSRQDQLLPAMRQAHTTGAPDRAREV